MLPLRLMSSALVEQLLQLRVHGEAGGRVVERVADELDDLLADAGGVGLADRRRPARLGTLEVGDGVGVVRDDRDRVGLGGVRLDERALEAVLEVAVRRLVLLLGDVAAADEGLGVEGADASAWPR